MKLISWYVHPTIQVLPSYGFFGIHACDINKVLMLQVEVEMEDVEEDHVLDIDSSDVKDPLAVVEYIESIHAHYRGTEVKLTIIIRMFLLLGGTQTHVSA